jgi:hypothetical protein
MGMVGEISSEKLALKVWLHLEVMMGRTPKQERQHEITP